LIQKIMDKVATQLLNEFYQLNLADYLKSIKVNIHLVKKGHQYGKEGLAVIIGGARGGDI